MTLHYSLNDDNLVDYSLYMARHDQKMLKTLVKLEIAVMLPFLVLLFLMKDKMTYGILAAAAFLADWFLFPKLFWKLTEQRIQNEVRQKNTQYPPITVRFSDDDFVIENGTEQTVRYSEVSAIAFTRDTGIIIFRGNQSLLLPLGDDEKTTELLHLLHDKLPDKLRN